MPVRYSADEHQRGEERPANVRRLGEVVVAIVAVALLALSATFFATGAQHNATLSDIEHHGVRVTVTVTSCTGLLGGSGSNGAGYTCKGSFTLDHERYESALPDNAAHGAGDKVVDVTPADNPGHLSTLSAWRTDRPSARVYIPPIVLGVAGLLAAALLVRSVVRRRRSAPAAGAGA
jgi:hypothetical protein